MVGGRYLATFWSNCFGISRNQVAALVAAAVLVATSVSSTKAETGHTFSMISNEEIASVGQTISSTLAGFHREGGRTSAVRLSEPSEHGRCVIKLSKNEVQAVYPWGLGWSRRGRVKYRVAPSL